MRSLEALGDRSFVQPCQQRHPLAQRGGEIEFTPHRALGDRGDLRLDPGIVGEFVDAFLPDHGRIHVGDEQPRNLEQTRRTGSGRCRGSAGRGSRGPRPVRLRAAGSRWRCCRSGRVSAIATGQPRAASSSRAASRLLASVAVSAIRRAMSTDDSLQKARPTAAAGAHCRADRERQERSGGSRWRSRTRRTARKAVVINADSAQVYADLRGAQRAARGRRDARRRRTACSARGTARPPVRRRTGRRQRRREIAAAHAAGALPILVGGTGLYIRTLLDGIAPIPPIDPAMRAGSARPAPARGARCARARRPRRAARLAPADAARIARALEVVRSTGQDAGANGRARRAAASAMRSNSTR